MLKLRHGKTSQAVNLKPRVLEPGGEGRVVCRKKEERLSREWLGGQPRWVSQAGLSQGEEAGRAVRDFRA